ncbi:MAG TPA: trehalose-phosphatase, partial [Candidatus Eisenbacteria bacterium]|nr:trehalose-phosphatase [Candidatus Eisenbacteria bacterium]
VPYPGIREILADALSSADCRTVIVSGRSISDLLPLLGIEKGIEIWGCHGWERRGPAGDYMGPELGSDVLALLDKAASMATEAGFGESLEIKAACVAIHWRGLDDRNKAALKDTVGAGWLGLSEGTELEVHPFNGGLELRPAGMDKGVVVERLLSETGGAAAYLGDDLTDEDAFRAISGRGIGVLVRPVLRKTAADIWLVPPGELLSFLGRWIESCGGRYGK